MLWGLVMPLMAWLRSRRDGIGSPGMPHGCRSFPADRPRLAAEITIAVDGRSGRSRDCLHEFQPGRSCPLWCLLTPVEYRGVHSVAMDDNDETEPALRMSRVADILTLA